MDFNEHKVTQLVDQAYKRIQGLYDYYQLSFSDHDKFQNESPAIMQSINKIESSAFLSYEEMLVICHKWIENYHLLFKRRIYFKRLV